MWTAYTVAVCVWAGRNPDGTPPWLPAFAGKTRRRLVGCRDDNDVIAEIQNCRKLGGILAAVRVSVSYGLYVDLLFLSHDAES